MGTPHVQGKFGIRDLAFGEVSPLTKIRPLKIAILKYVYRALMANEWNRMRTAAQLGISIKTIRSYAHQIEQMGYDCPKGKRGPSEDEYQETCL